MAASKKRPVKKRPRPVSCPYSHRISFELDQATVDRLPTLRDTAYLRGKLVNGKVIVEDYADRPIFLPSNVCWWDRVQEKAGGKKPASRTPAKRSK
jgi:hypothetical protein